MLKQGKSRLFAALFLVAAAYLGSGVSALMLYPVGNGLTGVWPAAGVGVAAILILGPIASLGIFVGDFLVGIHTGWAPGQALTLAFGSVGESLISWFMLVRLVPIKPTLERIRDVNAFIALGALPSAVLCVMLRVALMTAAGLEPASGADFPSSIFDGFVGHALGILIIAPMLLTWLTEPAWPTQMPEFWLLVLSTLLLNVLAFAVTLAAPGSAVLYAIFVAVLWAALRFGPRETSLVIALTSIFATWAAGRGSGPFLLSNPNEALISYSLFLFVAAATALFLAAATCERRLYLRRIVDSEHTQRALIEQMAEGVIILDRRGRLTFASERFCTLCGEPSTRLIGLRLSDLFQGAGSSSIDTLTDALHGDRDFEAEATLAAAGMVNRCLVITARRLTDAGGQPIGVMAVVADITDRRRAEERAQQHLRQLAHIGRVKSLDEMAIAFAHEVAQPLTAITTYVQAAQRFLQADEIRSGALRVALEGASAQARRASTIVTRIRAFVQDRQWQPSELPVQALLHETMRFAEPEARHYGARLSVIPGCTRCRIRGDEIQMQQVLINLVRNAAEAMAEHASPQRQITLAGEAIGNGLIDISVRDSGPGIEAHDRDRLFDPFFTTKENGAGIGLALCRSIIEAHGGKLWVESSAAGGGALFHIVLHEVHHGTPATT